MTYEEYIRYHNRGDAGVEERMIASLSRALRLNSWDSFRLIYFYTMTYHIPSALSMLLEGQRDIKQLQFRTDRRYVRCNGAYDRLLNELNRGMFGALMAVKTTAQAYSVVSSWYFFGRYAAFLFLEVYINVFKPKWTDDLRFKWEPEENYTKGAVFITQNGSREVLDAFLESAKMDTKDNCFAIETSLCAVAKFFKGTRYDGYYTERMLNEAENSKYRELIYNNVG